MILMPMSKEFKGKNVHQVKTSREFPNPKKIFLSKHISSNLSFN